MIAAAVVLPNLALGNDGQDRTRGHQPNLLMLFPEPTETAGYRVLQQDAAGGADGDRAFRWARPHAIAIVRLAAYRTAIHLGPARFAPAIFDLSAENGDTPIQWTTGRPPRGRHPGGSHDGGINLDIGYFLTNLAGKEFSPDYAGCTEHFDGKKDAWQCRGPADRLDVARQTFFLLQLFKLDAAHFDSQLIEEIGIDRRIRDAVLKQTARWQRARRHGTTRGLLARMRQTFTADRWEGWARAHHHHIHLRLRDLPISSVAEGHAQLLAAERQMDENLLTRPPFARADRPALRARLLSYALRRAVQIELVGVPKNRAPARVRFQVDGGKWVAPDPADYSGFRAVIDLPRRLRAKDRTIVASAELTDKRGTSRIIRARITAPRQQPYLAVSIDPHALRASARRLGARWQLVVDLPPVYETLVTKVSFLLYQLDKDPRKLIARRRAEGRDTQVGRGVGMGAGPPAERREVIAKRKSPGRHVATYAGPPPQLIEARVIASGRKAFVVPVYARPPRPPKARKSK